MTTFDTSGNILTEVQDISNYVIPGTISVATFLRFLTKAEEQVTLDDPGFKLEQCTEAVALYICHQIFRKTGEIGVKSKSLGSASISRVLKSDLTPWMDEYQALIARVRSPIVSISTLDPNGITRVDQTSDRLRPDQAMVVDANDGNIETTNGTISDMLGVQGYP